MPPFTCCETLLINHLRRFLFGFFRSLAFCSFFINLLVHPPLLGDGQNVIRQPVQHQTGSEDEEHHAEDERHDQHHLGLRRISGFGLSFTWMNIVAIMRAARMNQGSGAARSLIHRIQPEPRSSTEARSTQYRARNTGI